MKNLLKAIKEISLTTFNGFSNHSLMTYAASIAFYTIFSLPGLLITIIMSAGFFLGQDAAQGEIVVQLEGIIGTASAKTVQEIISKTELSGNFTWKTIFGVGTLLFSATTIFISLQEALNKIWDVVATPKKGFVKIIINRVLSFGMIVSLGFILLVSLLLDTLLELFFNQIENVIGKEPSFWLDLSTNIASIALTYIVIMLIFKILPDVKLKWKDVAMAAAITTVFLMSGSYLIGIYIKSSSFSQTYDAAGSIIIILIWVYYSSIVLLFGAEITRAILFYKGRPIRPSKNAKKIKVQKLDYDEYKSKFKKK